MDAPTLTSAEERELAALRRRAYGPGADIASDPDAVARLERLEEAAHPAPASQRDEVEPGPITVQAATPPDAAADTWFAGSQAAGVPALESVADTRSEGDTELDGAEPASDVDATPRARRRWLGRVPVWAWLGAAAVVLIIATVVWGVERLTAPQADLTLGPVTTDDSPPVALSARYPAGMYDVDLDQLQQYESHRALQLWSADNTDGVRCLFVRAPQFDNGILDSCAPSGLDPSIDLPIWPGLPDEIAGELPEGSVLRFVLHDGRVYVWESEAPPSTEE